MATRPKHRKRQVMAPVALLLAVGAGGSVFIGAQEAASANSSAQTNIAQVNPPDTPLPANGVQSLEYVNGAWTLTLQQGKAWEVKLINPAPQEIVCSANGAGGAPGCGDKTVFTFASQAECITVQVDWKDGAYNSSDPDK